MSPAKGKLRAPFSLENYLKTRRAMVETALDNSLQADGRGHKRLREAIRYSLLAGGKRLRPILTIASCEAVGADAEIALLPALALEYVHTYSLIHDDLPAMDDAAIRRGKPTCHKAFDEATAILAGDALLTEAFHLLAKWGADSGNGALVVGLIRELASAAGVEGMVSGQAFDLEESGPADIDALDRLHALKTGAIIRASVRMGALAGGAKKAQLVALTGYAERIGLAFQIVDDLLDDEGEGTGKDIGSDAARGKRTYPMLAGREESRRRASELIKLAKAELASFGQKAQPLKAIADYIIVRKN